MHIACGCPITSADQCNGKSSRSTTITRGRPQPQEHNR